jgi:hypothetical protein
MSVIDYDEYQAELRRRREALPETWKNIDWSRLTHKPRDPEKRRWLEERGLLTTPKESEGPWRPRYRKP